MSIDIEKFATEYRVVYTALYESDELIDYDRLVEVGEWLVRNNAPYKRLVRAFYEHTLDVPTSDREIAAFVMTARAMEVIGRSAA